MKNIQNISAFVFIAAVIILTGISIMGIWDVFGHDVIMKSVKTMGLLAVVSIIVMISNRFIEAKGDHDLVPQVPDPSFTSIRKIVLVVLIAAASILALLGILAIWNVFPDMSVLYKSLGSVAILAFSSFVIVLTCLDRENSPILHKKSANSAGPMVAILIILVFVFILTLGAF